MKDPDPNGLPCYPLRHPVWREKSKGVFIKKEARGSFISAAVLSLFEQRVLPPIPFCHTGAFFPSRGRTFPRYSRSPVPRENRASSGKFRNDESQGTLKATRLIYAPEKRIALKPPLSFNGCLLIFDLITRDDGSIRQITVPA